MFRFSIHSIILLTLVCVAKAPTVDALICPGSVEFQPTGSSNLDPGWTGIGHRSPVLGWTLDMKIGSCPSANGSTCGQCTIQGLIPNSVTSNQRCANDTAIACQDDAPCQAQPGRCEGGSSNGATCTTDANCANGTCRRRCAFFTAAPTSYSSGGVGACLTEQVTAAVTGTVDVEQGTLNAAVPLQTNIYTGPFDNPCPRCVGDTTANDGLKSGACSDGLHAGQPCDAARHGYRPASHRQHQWR